ALTAEADEKAAEITRLNAELEEKDMLIAALSAEADEKAAEIRRLTAAAETAAQAEADADAETAVQADTDDPQGIPEMGD
nr:hypothetical protein [Oscillospiraceae bacterium]